MEEQGRRVLHFDNVVPLLPCKSWFIQLFCSLGGGGFTSCFLTRLWFLSVHVGKVLKTHHELKRFHLSITLLIHGVGGWFSNRAFCGFWVRVSCSCPLSRAFCGFWVRVSCSCPLSVNVGKGKGRKTQDLINSDSCSWYIHGGGGFKSNYAFCPVRDSWFMQFICSSREGEGECSNGAWFMQGRGGGNAWPGPCSFSTSINMLNKFVFCNFRTMDAEESTTTTATRTTDPGTTIDQQDTDPQPTSRFVTPPPVVRLEA